MLDRRLFKHIDWTLILLTVLLVSISMVLLYSASFQSAEDYYNRQLIWLIGAIVIFFIGIIFPYNWLIELSGVFYTLSLISLVMVLLIGQQISGSKSWIRFSWLSLQPSEFAKITTL